MDLLFYSLAIQLSALVAVVLLRNSRTASAVAHLLLLAGLISGFIPTLCALVLPDVRQPAPSICGLPQDLFRFDALGLYFLCIVQLVAIPTTIYSYSSIKHYMDKGKSIKQLLVFYPILLVATQLTVIANHSILFLVCWELMSTAAYLGMIFEKEKRDVQTGSFYYLVMTHVVVFILYIFFFLLHH